jgi:hypothetical protein
MKRISCLLLSLIVFVFTTVSSAGQGTEKETRNVSGFNEINFGIAGNLYIKLGSDFQVILEGDRKLLPEVETIVKNGKLLIRKEYFRIFENERVNVYITLPEIKAIGVSGSGKAKIESTIKNEALDFDVSGSGSIIAAEVNTGEFDCSISGSGNIVMEGVGEIGKANIAISGSGNYNGERAIIKILKVGISGSGNCTCNVSESLNASISGSGNIGYFGDPKVDARVSGSGHVRSK